MPEPREGDITPAQRQQLDRYLDEIERWRPRQNLTTVRREQSWARHVGQTLGLLGAARPADGGSMVDIGSGAGVPGVVVAILRPDLEVTLLEASSRRSAFLVHVCGMLRLARVRVDSRRAEEAAHDPAMAGRFDLAVSRAAAPPARLCELALPLLRPGGELWAMVSDARRAAAVCAATAHRLGGTDPLAAAPGLLTLSRQSPGVSDAGTTDGAAPAPPRPARPRGPARRPR